MNDLRIEALRKRTRVDRIAFSVEKARLFTEEYRRQDGKPEVIRTALAQAYVLDNITIFIIDGERIVGAPAAKEMAIEADFWNKGVWTDEGIESLRDEGTYNISAETADEMKALSSYWRNIITDYKVLDLYDDEMWRWKKSGFLLPACKTLEQAAGSGFAGNGFTICGDAADINSLDYGYVISRGLRSYIEATTAELAALTPDKLNSAEAFRKREYLQAALITQNAVIRFAERYALLAENLAKTCEDEARRAELEKIADVCRRVPAEPPRCFQEAVQFMWFLFLMFTNRNTTPLERFDQYALPYYEADVAAMGEETAKDNALELLECLRIKFMSLKSTSGGSTRKKWSGFARWNNMTIGGVKADGSDATNALTYLVLEAAYRCRVPHHTITLRVHSGTPEELMRAALRLVRTGIGFPAFVGDKSYIACLTARGVPLEKAREYYMMGCIDCNVPEGMGHIFSMIVIPLALDTFLHNGYSPWLKMEVGPKTGDVCGFATFDEFEERLLDHIEYYLRLHARDNDLRYYVGRDILPDAFTSSLYSDGVKVGKIGRYREMPYRLGPTMNVGVGAINVADSLYSIKHLVYDTHTITMRQLIDAMDDNWQSEESARIHRLCAELPKFGNNVAEVDEMAHRFYKGICSRVWGIDSPRGTKYNAGAISITSYEPGGALVGATPDGRYAGETLADGCVSPSQGKDRRGPLAVLNSAMKVEQDDTMSMLLNMKIHPSALKSESDFAKLSTMIRTYFEGGGKHIQFNVVDREMLIRARENPENYSDLIVRVAGYSAYFTQLSPAVQNDIINRTEHSL